ncbi:DUF2157 domain-containing protein [candidate division KSB1 bacterium]|nr:DUF2157 domain-containing protein [candidate division KSB1 bacterium]
MRLIRLLKKDLAQETVTWVEKGIISKDQADAICSHYGIDFNDQSSPFYGYSVLVMLAYLFLGLAVITLISANWETIPRLLRMTGLIALTIGVQVWGLVNYRSGNKNAAVAWLFLGSLFYGASIMLIAQIYHIGEHFPDGIFWWAIGVLPLALLLRSTLLMTLAFGLGFIWFFVESSLNFYPTLFPLFLVALLWQLVRGKQSYTLFIGLMMGFVFWSEYTLAWYLNDSPGFYFGSEHLLFAIGMFIPLHGFAKWLVQRNNNSLIDYGTVLAVWTLRFGIILFFILSFEGPWRALLKSEWRMPELVLILAVLFSLAGVAFSYIANRQIISTVFFGVVYVGALVALFWFCDENDSLTFQFISNIILLAIGIWLITQGIKSNISHYFFLGVVTILLTGLLRYIDFVGDYIGATVLFTVFAALLLFAARYWKAKHVNARASHER